MKLKYYLRGIGIGILVTFLILYFSGKSNNEMTNEEIIAKAKGLGMIENTTLASSSLNKTASINSTIDDDISVFERVENSVNSDKNNNIYVNDDTLSLNVVSENETVNNRSDSSALAADISETDINDNGDNNKNLEEDNKENNKEDNKENNKEDNKEDNKENNKEDNKNDNQSADDSLTSTDQNTVETKTITIIAGDSSYSAAKKLQQAGLVESAAKYDEYLCKNGYDKYIVIGTHTIPVNSSDKDIAIIITSRKR